MATHHPIRKTVAHPTPVIPDKLYFRIGDVARICEVPAYVLRFWETEFPNLKPNKGGTGQRLYRRKDVETALRIKHLLYDLGYTIPGARQVFKTDARPEAPALAAAPAAVETPAASAEPHNKTVILSGAHSAQSKDPEALNLAITARAFSTDTAPRLHALRDELRALHTQLSAPVSTEPAPEPLRPRLVAEPKRPRLHKPEPRLEPRLGPIAIPGQQDLFPAE
ncbi:MerR family transcriptional regulator [Granulicella sp. 5B5]|uniref:MerR family transcriptional regulator n=1 Tax=Granulicella sp. 5B5 TaxID=1617967 RepID=UPI00210714F2|nr:MerR family transcriptional regulator [Granulicella sp. 5B5]